MFSTILKEVTGYFDKRALLSAFFPAMIFWGLTIILVLLCRMGWSVALETWNQIPVTGQLLLLLTFFIWVAFWAFLTLNFHSLLLRVYEGYWPFALLVQLRTRHWQKRWDDMDRRDSELEKWDSLLDGERREFEALRQELKTIKPEPPQEPTAQLGGKIDLELSDIKQKLSALDQEIVETQNTYGRLFSFLASRKRVTHDVEESAGPRRPAPGVYDQLVELGSRVRETWRTYSKNSNLARPVQGDPWTRRREDLDEISGALTKTVEKLGSEVEQQRLALHHEFFLMFPPYRKEVVPTGLGNVLKAAEARVRLRYQLDALLAWSRLEPLLPVEATESLQNAKTSLDLMLTLSASLLLFGVPLSIWLMLQTNSWFAWWLPLIVLASAVVARFRVAVIPAAIAVGVSFMLPVSGPASQRFLSGTEVVLTAFAGLSLMSWVCYQNAVQSCLVYGEKIQSAFDLYRWKLFDELHLQLPPSLEEEREMWKQVGALLYRGYEPSSEYFRYVIDEKKTKAPAGTEDVPVGLQVPAKSKQQVDEQVAIGIEVNQADILGGKLESGDQVDIIITAYNSAPVKYENILVLDVSVVDVAAKNGRLPTLQPVVVVALSRDQQEEFIVRKRFGNVSLTRRI